jgi:hypothetical protein
LIKDGGERANMRDAERSMQHLPLFFVLFT